MTSRSRAPEVFRSESRHSAQSLKRQRSGPDIGPEFHREHKRTRSNAINPEEATTSGEEDSDEFVFYGSENDDDEGHSKGGDEDSNPEESSINHVNSLPGRRYQEITDHGLGDSVVILPELKAIICRLCNYTVPASYLVRHFNEQGHLKHFTDASVKKKMAELDIPMKYKPELPSSGCLVPTGLKPVDYWKCGGCQLLFDPEKTIWQRHSCSKKSQISTTVAHWKPHKPFEVITHVSEPDAHMTVEKWAEKMLLDLQESKESLIINPTTPASRIHPFLIRSGWIDFFRPLEMAHLETLKEYTTLPPPDDPIRNLLQKVFEELQGTLKVPSNYEYQYHLFAPKGCVAYNKYSVFT